MTVAYDRDARLRDVKNDPTGWGFIDLAGLLEAWDFDRVTLGVRYGSELWNFWHEYNPKDCSVVLPASDPIAVGTVEHIVRIIEWVRDHAPGKGPGGSP